MFGVHFDGDFVVESGRELLDVALWQFSRFRVRCLVVGHHCVFGDWLNTWLGLLKQNEQLFLRSLLYFTFL